MDFTFEDDMFALSDEDEELPAVTSECNPIEEHFMKQLSDVQNRIEQAKSDIQEFQDTTKRILKSLYSEAQYGEADTSDSESNLYTAEGEPVIEKKKQKCHDRKQILILKSSWKRIISDKWVIGVLLQNTSTETLCRPRFYVDVHGETEVHGTSTFWYLMEKTFWYKTSTIAPRSEVVATVVLDLPKFDRNCSSDAYGTIVYEVDEKQYQTPVPNVSLHVDETVDGSCTLKFSDEPNCSILALKSVATEKIIAVDLKANIDKGVRLLEFLETRSFKEVSTDVYIVKAMGSVTYCMVEVLPLTAEYARFRISARSSTQMSIMLRLLRDEFPDLTVEEDNICIVAAMALLQELNLYLHEGSAAERQRARIKTDLLIP